MRPAAVDSGKRRGKREAAERGCSDWAQQTIAPKTSLNPPQIIMAVNDYTKALQDGLRIVANS